MRRGVLVAGVGVLVLVLAGLVAVGRVDDFTGRCVGGTLLVEGLFDPVDVDATATDPLHLAATMPVGPAAPAPGDQVTVVSAALPPPGITAIVTAVGSPVGGRVALTISVWPRDHLAQVLVPGTPARVTLRTNVIGKAETISADSLRPGPAPGRATIWLAGPGAGDAPLGGRAHPVAVTVDRVVQGRAIVRDADPPLPAFSVGGTWPIVVPDHHCLAGGFWPPVLWSTREWSPQADQSLAFATDRGGPLPPPTTAPPGRGGLGTDTIRHTWNRPVRELELDDPLDADGGITVTAGAVDHLDEALALSWRGDRPVLGEDWVGPYYEHFWTGGDTRRSAVGCTPAAGHACSARYTISAPPAVTVFAHTVDAPIDVHGLTGDVNLTSAAGAITLDGLSAGQSSSATSETGDVVGTGLTLQELDVHAGGRIDVRLLAPPLSVRVTGTRNAPVTLELPRGADYDIDTDAFPQGRRDIAVPSTPGAAHHVTARSDGGGDVTVRYAP